VSANEGIAAGFARSVLRSYGAGSFFHAVEKVSMNVSELDLAAISQALDDHDPDREHFLDMREGSLWTFVFSEATDETRSRLAEARAGEGSTHRRIPSMTAQEAYEEVEDFVEGLTDPEAQDRLFAALENRGALRNFRQALLMHAETRQGWTSFRRERSQNRLERFLAELGVEEAETKKEGAT
jgi:hypothetical protein